MGTGVVITRLEVGHRHLEGGAAVVPWRASFSSARTYPEYAARLQQALALSDPPPCTCGR
jgi:hypothetical protein